MNRVVALIAFVLLVQIGFTQNTTVKIDNAKQTFTTVSQGAVVKVNYVITNDGTVPLLLNDYEVECSCTSAEYDKSPILPGKSTTVVVLFDTKSAYERQDRVVLINCNTKDGRIKLRFKGNILKKKS